MSLVETALLALVVLGMLPTLALFAQFLVVGVHGVRNHYARCGDYTPRVAFVLPAWNEAQVLGASIDSLMQLSYPTGAWRIYVVDDASTDATPEVLREKIARYPGSVFHLRREKGGEGKAHTLNHGLKHVLADDWAQAVMIMDADVLFEPTSLRRMTRHLADPQIASVTAYVKEGSDPGNLVTRFIAFEYIAAQAAARRAQNVGGTLACLAGGAQLHSRANLEAIGGRIDTSSLAEDTYTTFATQLAGRRVLFEGNAVVWAEEPDSLAALWKQRLRWARGNLQITRAFGRLWFRPWRHRGLGGIGFGIVWFSILLTPVLAVLSSIGLLGLYARGDAWAWAGFAAVWRITIAVYLFETLYAFLIDPATARRAWLQGLLFPGSISLAIMLALIVPSAWTGLAVDPTQPASGALRWLMPVMYAWNSLSMLAAWAVYRLEKAGLPNRLRDLLLVLVGYGAFMNAIAFAAMVAQWRKVEQRWDKTMKSGKARIPG
ncbi:glycosyltransferase [Tahibacter sp. UC22_41]|uniref:glycosyltransferase n=1 Tax=Tahibacter sp. UC22_41 TaxID=3350178 RepID=UPI0036D9F62F